MHRPTQSKQDSSENNPFFDAIQSVFDTYVLRQEPFAVRSFPVRSYVTRRRGEEARDVGALLSQLPESLRRYDLGTVESELLDFFVNDQAMYRLNLIAPRGGGKSSIVNYCARVLEQERAPIKVAIARFDNTGTERLTAERVLHRCATALAINNPSVPTQEGGLLSVLTRYIQENGEAGLVFDNLDHLRASDLDLVFDVSSELHDAGGFRIVRCVRPASMHRTRVKSSPRNVYSYEIRVRPPLLRDVFEAGVEELTSSKKLKDAIIGEVKYTGDQLANAVKVAYQIVTATGKSRRKSDAIDLVEGVAADDIRHAKRLFRRILQHRNFPYEEALKGSTLDVRGFFPMTSLLEGSREDYTDCLDVRNILFAKAEQTDSDIGNQTAGTPDYLVKQRVLVLLRLESRVPVRRLLFWLKLLGHRTADASHAIVQLHGGGLVEFSDTEQVSTEEVEAASGTISLSASGLYFLQNLLRHPDYLLSAVMDTLLQHPDLPSDQHRFSFSDRVRSLLEYCQTAHNHEYSALDSIKGAEASADMERVISSLRHSQTLTAALAAGVAALAASRERFGSNESLREKVMTASESLTDGQETLERKLEELSNRTRRWREDVIRANAGGYLLAVKFGEGANNYDLFVSDSESEELPLEGIIRVPPTGGDDRGSSGVYAFVSRGTTDVSGDRDGVLSGHAPSFDVKRLSSPNDQPRLAEVPEVSETGSTSSFLLANTDLDGMVRLELVVRTRSSKRTHTISKDGCSLSDLRKAIKRMLSKLQCAILSYTTSPEDAKAELKHAAIVIGSVLADGALSDEGKPLLANAILEAEQFIVVTDIDDIPWELAAVPIDQVTGDVELICARHTTRCRRWTDSIGQLIGGNVTQSLPAARRVICAGAVSNAAETHVEASTYVGLVRAVETGDVVHLVGHRDGQDVFVHAGDERDPYAVCSEDIQVKRLPSIAVVLSACSSGSAGGPQPAGTALARGFASAGKTVVWAPHVDVSTASADAIQSHLAKFAEKAQGQTWCIDSAMNRTDEEPLLSIYFRFG